MDRIRYPSPRLHMPRTRRQMVIQVAPFYGGDSGHSQAQESETDQGESAHQIDHQI